MLDTLRKGASGWIAQIFIGLLVLTFAIWGVSDVFTGFRSDAVATVGRSDISITTYQRAFDVAVRRFNQQYGQQLTADQAKGTGMPAEVLGQLVGDAALSDTARSMGLGVSNTTLATQIANDPTFRGPTGSFDRVYFQQVLNNAGLTEDAYLMELKASYVRKQITDALTGGAAAPDAYMRALHEYRNEERSISYVVLTPAAITGVGEPTDVDLQTFFDAHKDEYRAPELRAANVVKMVPADISKPDEVSDEEAKKNYDANLATAFTKPEKRKVEQIVFKDKADADAATASLAAGKTFDDLMSERSLKPTDVDLGLITRQTVVDPKVAEAAFALAAPGVTPIFEGRFGPAIVRVASIEPEKVTTFDEAKADIKKNIANSRAVAEVSDQRDMVEDARAGGETLAEIAKKYELPQLTLPAIDSTGNDDKGDPIKDVPGGGPMVTAIAATDVGIENEPLAIEGGFAWYEVTNVTQPRDRTLAEVREKVVAAWKKNQVDTKLNAKASEIRDRLAKGDDIVKVAADNGLEVKTFDKLTRATEPKDDITASIRQAAFAGPKGSAAIADGTAEQSKAIVLVTDANVPPYFSNTADMTQAQEQLSQQISSGFLTEYVAQLQNQLGVRVNQTTLSQALGAPGT